VDFDKLEFTPILRQDVLDQIKKLCREEYTEFIKLLEIFSDLDKFLASKYEGHEENPKEYFTRLFHIRVKDHFSSSLILISQGYLVDAISLTRSALEDLFVMLNFYLDPGYFSKWNANCNDFEIRPGKLRNNPKIDKNDRKLYNKVYKSLCDIVHPKKESFAYMSTFHPTFQSGGRDGAQRLKKDMELINLSFVVYLHQISSLFLRVYDGPNQDVTTLESIKTRVMETQLLQSLL